MARYTGPVCRLCRREGEKLFLKGDRCYSTKCAVERRESGPGVHSRPRGRSEYKTQLREKQKVKRMYGLLERQFRKLFGTADRKKGITGENLLIGLESRLDNLVYRGGFASSRKEARQFVNHGHFLVNGAPVNVASYRLKPGDVIQLKEKSRTNPRVSESIQGTELRKIPDWLELDREQFKLNVRAMPTRQELTHPMKEQLIVELYSK